MSGLLSIRNLTVEFQTAGGLFRAVDGFDLDVDKSDIVSIVGESGSGKSVAMLALMGLLPWTANVTADKMEFMGTDLRNLPQKIRRHINGKHLAMIFQEPMTSLNPCFTVGFQISESLKVHEKMNRAARRRKTIELLDQVGIPDAEKRLNAFPHQLSGGMNQRVMIAIAIACNPALLIADEPTTALDVTIQAQILDLLAELQSQRGMALVLITHDMGVVAQTARHVVVQYAGQQVERQDVIDLFDTPRHPYTAALLSSLPERATGGKLPSIPGVVPGQFNRPEGCLFNPRCSDVQGICKVTPPAAAADDEARTLCHFPLIAGRKAS